jgi:DNA-binding LacI/PurR family transcriptional regulator
MPEFKMPRSSKLKSFPTQADVAKLAGVSRTTVSYVLSNNASVSIPEETRQRIRNAVEELGYTPHTQAQRLRSGKTNTITMLFPWDENCTQIELEFLTGAARAATEEEYFFNLITAPVSEETLLNLYRGRQTDGVILMQIRLRDWRVDLLREHAYPFVIIGSCEDNTGVSFVDIEYDKAIFKAFEHLVELGHREIGFLTFPARWYMDGNTGPVQCMQGYEQARREFGITTAFREVALSVDDMYQAMTELLNELPRMTGLVTSYSATLAGAYRALSGRGLRIPDDFSVVGIAGEASAGLMIPALTGFDSRNFERGYRAAEILLKTLQSDAPVAEHVFLPFELIVRETTAPPPR